MVEQEALLGFWCVFFKAPCARAFADRVPRPDRIGVYAIHQFGLAFDLPVMGGDGYPISIFNAKSVRAFLGDVEPIAAKNLPEP